MCPPREKKSPQISSLYSIEWKNFITAFLDHNNDLSSYTHTHTHTPSRTHTHTHIHVTSFRNLACLGCLVC